MDRFDEVAVSGGDEEVDRIEVCLAVETAAEVGAEVDGRQVSLAARAEEGDLPVALLVGPAVPGLPPSAGPARGT